MQKQETASGLSLQQTTARSAAPSAPRRRALCIAAPRYSVDGLPDLTDAPQVTERMAAALERLGFEAEIVAERGLIGKALGEKVHAHLTSANPDDLLVVHVLGHGLLTREGATVYVLGEDGVEHELADAAQWVSSTQTLPGRPQTLFLLDLCSSGVLARLPWQQAVSASTNRAWVVAACSPDELAYDGRFTQAVTDALEALARGDLDTDAALEHTPLTIVARAVRQGLNRIVTAEDGYAQQVTATMVDLSEEEHTAFFPNPRYRRDRRAHLRGEVDRGVWPFLADLDEGLDARHFLDRAAGVSGLRRGADELIGCFTGRSVQVRQLSRWMNGVRDADFPPGALSVVRGSPGVGKSALLGVLVCAAHPALRDVTKPLWDRVEQSPLEVPGLVAVHARRRSTAEVCASLGRQLGLEDVRDPNALVQLLRGSRWDRPPVVIVDAVDEANDGAGLASSLLTRLADERRPDGVPLARLLVGVRSYKEYEPLFERARALRTLVDLDDVPEDVLEDDLNTYVLELLRTTVVYRPRHAVAGAFAGSVAGQLASLGRDTKHGQRWGEFLVAGLYTRYFISFTADAPISSPERAQEFGEGVPRDLPRLLDLDFDAQRDRPWLRPVMRALALAQGQGMPASVIARVATRLADEGVGAPDGVLDVRGVLDTLEAAKVYLRQSSDVDGTALYRLFHQGLVDHLQGGISPYQDTLLEALLEPLGPRQDRDWAAAEPYVLHHAAAHAQAAGRLDEVVDDPNLLGHPRFRTVLEAGAQAGSDRARRLLDLSERAAGLSPADLALEAARAGLLDLAHHLAGTPDRPKLSWAPWWTMGRRQPKPQDQPAPPEPEAPREPPELRLEGATSATVTDAGIVGIVRGDTVELLRIVGSALAPLNRTVTGTAVAITPDGRTVVTGDNAGMLRIVDPETGQAVTVSGNGKPVAALTVSPGGSSITVATRDGAAFIHDRGKRRNRNVVDVAGLRLPLDKLAATGGSPPVLVRARTDGRITVDTKSRTVGGAGHTGEVTALAVDAYAGLAVSGGADGAVIAWDLRKGTSATLCARNAARVVAVGLASTGAQGVCIHADGAVHAWQVADALVRQNPAPPPAQPTQPVGPSAVLMPPAAPDAVVVSAPEGISVIELATGQQLPGPRRRGKGAGAAQRLWRQELMGNTGICIQWGDGSTLFWVVDPRTAFDVTGWDGLHTPAQVRAIRRSSWLGPQLVQVVADGEVVRLALPRAAAPLAELHGHRAEVGPVVTGAGGGRLLAASGDREGRICLWDVEERRLADVLEVGDPVLGLDLDDGWLVALTETETIVFRQMASQQTPAAGA